ITTDTNAADTSSEPAPVTQQEFPSNQSTKTADTRKDTSQEKSRKRTHRPNEKELLPRHLN
uniref:Uncharacterized protein n=2 Tax=Ixodes scapularis TaxID=6945 RepID=A0A1S4KV29_IXOSC